MSRDSSRLLIDESPLQVLPSLACLLGGSEPAIVLQQVHYWVGVIKKTKQRANYRDGHWWVHNTYPEWRETFPWIPERTLRRIMAMLEGRGDKKLPRLLISEQPSGSDRRKWYRIDYDALNELVAASEAAEGVGTEEPETARQTGADEEAEQPSPSSGQSGLLSGDDPHAAKVAASRSTGQNGRLEEADVAASSMPLDVSPQTTTPSVGSPSTTKPRSDRGSRDRGGGGGRAHARGKPKSTPQAPPAAASAAEIRDALRRGGHPVEVLEDLIDKAVAALAQQTPGRVTDPLAWCVGYVTRRADEVVAKAERDAEIERRRRDPELSWIFDAVELVENGDDDRAEELLGQHGWGEDGINLVVHMRWDADRVIERLGLVETGGGGDR